MKIFRYGNPSASTFLIQPIDDHDLGELKTEINEIRKQVQIDFQLIAVKVDDWNRDLSPWKAPAVFGKDGFGDGAKDMLRFILAQCMNCSKTYYNRRVFPGGVIFSVGSLSDRRICRNRGSFPLNLVSKFPAVYEGTRCQGRFGLSQFGRP